MDNPNDEKREAALDAMLADSFPGSDPPCFTPVMGVGTLATQRRRRIPKNSPGPRHRKREKGQ